MNAFENYPHLKGNLYVRPENYAGETFEGTATLYGVHRDSGLLEESNWATLQNAFKDDPGVIVTRAGHWAVGWIDSMRVLPDASDETKSKAEQFLSDLEDYPILDEDDLSERELEAAHKYWDGWVGPGKAPDLKMRLGNIRWWNEKNGHIPNSRVPIFAARHSLYKLSTLYPDFEMWIQDLARE